MENDINLIKKQLKDNIQQLVDAGDLQEAKELIEQYKNIDQTDVEVYSMDAVILIMQEKLEQAKQLLKEGLNIDEGNFDLNYNLGYVYEKAEKFNMALECYEKAKSNCNNIDTENEIDKIIEKLKKDNNITIPVIKKEKLGFICLKGLDNFIDDIIKELSNFYNVKKFVVTEEKNIYKAIDWADIVWLEWGNESSVLATKYDRIKDKKVIVRIHGYEVFTDIPKQINWNVVDKLIFVAEHKKNLFFEKFGHIIAYDKTCILRNGIDLNKFTIPLDKEKNKNIAFVGNINYRKGLELLIQFFYELIQIDPEFKLYVRGKYQDLRLKIYDQQIIEELGIGNNIIFVDRVVNLNKWFSNMTYIVSSSIEESFHYTIGEGMLAGLKPIIHAWKESRDIWPSKYIFRNKEEFLNIVLNKEYNPSEYRKFIEDNYSLNLQILKLNNIIRNILN